ncbi:protein FAM177A1-like [Panonychus citri]|uniref:protein FAM177A1-like n=1 Tax=Panonychus citri TaxID=50023 RepID=UPI002306F58A|nr:protein FAM177A1-like [Panonychus citri]
METSITTVNMINSNIVWTAVELTKSLGTKLLEGCDYIGEKLAFWFGITRPKYEAEIREYYWMKEQEKKKKSIEAEEFAGWKSDGDYVDSRDSVELIRKDLV